MRTLYRFIDEGELAAYKFGRVIRLKEDDVVGFVERSRIAPGSLDHLLSFAERSPSVPADIAPLYPEPVRADGH